MLAGLTVFSIMIKKGKSADVDVVKYYDCLYNITEDYKNGLSEEDIEAKYDCNLILSTDALSQEIVDSIKKRAVVMEFAPEGEIIGRVTWDTDLSEPGYNTDIYFHDKTGKGTSCIFGGDSKR